MADHTGIEWTDASWNPIVGCSIVSPGCTNCYAMSMARRIEAMQPGSHYAGTTKVVNGKAVWTGKVALAPEHILTQPLRWRRPRKIFVNSMGDLFHEDVPDAWIDMAFAVMALCPQHTFQVLTKRSARMRAYIGEPRWPNEEIVQLHREWIMESSPLGKLAQAVVLPRWRINQEDQLVQWPLPNVWLGVSTEDQRRADERVPDLLATPAAIRFVSAEPLLGPIDLSRYLWPVLGWWRGPYNSYAEAKAKGGECGLKRQALVGAWCTFLDQVIPGGESGPKARPMHPDWVRSLRDQCAAAGTAFFFKQWGEWLPEDQIRDGQHPGPKFFRLDGSPLDQKPPFSPSTGSLWHWWEPDHKASIRVGKRTAGRLLDGIEHNSMPEVRS